MDISQINTAIISGNFTNDQLTSINDALKFARSRLASSTKHTLRVGSKVSFTGRSGQDVHGEVDKINIKYIKVRSGMTMWRVPANLLTVYAGV
jgi:hypothetical protein